MIQESSTGTAKLCSQGKSHFWSYVIFFTVLALIVFYVAQYNVRNHEMAQERNFCLEMDKIFTSPVEMKDGGCVFSEGNE